jgi:hypothetical protein
MGSLRRIWLKEDIDGMIRMDDKKSDGWMEKNMDDWMIAFGKDDSLCELAPR